MDEIITSLQNEKVKLAYGLQKRAGTRRKERKIVLEGTRLVHDAIAQQHKPIFVLYEPSTADRALMTLLEQRKASIAPVSTEVMKYVSETPQPQGVVGVFHLPTPQMPSNPSRVLILDNMRDPGNLGTILRTAGAAGVDIVILSPGCADPYNPKALRSGMGAHFRVPIAEATWGQIAAYCDSLAVYLATGHGETPYDQVNWSIPWVLIIGNEAHGAGDRSEQLAVQRITIPMAGKTESLNAAVAAGVILFEAVRKKR